MDLKSINDYCYGDADFDSAQSAFIVTIYIFLQCAP